MKKVIAIVLVLVVVLSFAACRSNTTENAEENSEVIECTITKLDCTSSRAQVTRGEHYLASVISDKYTGTIEISNYQYALLAVGDVVEVTFVNNKPCIEIYKESLTISDNCEATVTKLACTSESGKVTHEYRYFAAVASVESAAIIKITAEQYATLNIGDTVSIEIIDNNLKIK